MDQKKGLQLEICADFHEFRGETTKRIFITKSAKKKFLPTNSGVITSRESQASNCTSVAPSLLLSLGHNPCLGGQFLFGGTSSDLGGHCPGMPPVSSGLLQVYSNLSNCNYRIFVTEILLEIDFIEEMRTI